MDGPFLWERMIRSQNQTLYSRLCLGLMSLIAIVVTYSEGATTVVRVIKYSPRGQTPRSQKLIPKRHCRFAYIALRLLRVYYTLGLSTTRTSHSQAIPRSPLYHYLLRTTED